MTTRSNRGEGRIHRHPLAALRARLGLSATEYLERLAARYAALGFGRMAVRREKVARWESGRTTPDRATQLALADLHDVAHPVVRRLGWPHWLHRAFADDTAVLDAPWTAGGAVDAATAVVHGAPADRRAYPVVVGPLAAQVLADWRRAHADPLPGPAAERPAFDPTMLGRLAERAEDLRWLRCVVDPEQIRPIALGDMTLLHRLISGCGVDRASGDELLRLLAATGLICSEALGHGGLVAPAQLVALTALRAATCAGDRALSRDALTALATGAYDGGDRDAGRLLADAAASVDVPLLRVIASTGRPPDRSRGRTVNVPRLTVSSPRPRAS